MRDSPPEVLGLITLSGARYLKNPTLLTYAGVSYDQLTHVDPIVGSKPVQVGGVFVNYNETGRDAVKFVLTFRLRI